MPAIVISSVSPKGRTGKTNACKFLGITKVREGKRVLVLDICQNSDIATRLGYDRKDFTYTSLEYLCGQVPFEYVVQHDEETGIDFIPSSEHIEKYLDFVNQTRPFNKEWAFKEKIIEIADKYDYIFIDNHPTAGDQMIYYSLFASDIAMIPTVMDGSSVVATERTIEIVNNFKKHGLPIKSMVIPFAVELTKGFRKYLQPLHEKFAEQGIDFYSSPVRYSSVIKSASMDNIVLPLDNKYVMQILEDYSVISKELEQLLPALQEG